MSISLDEFHISFQLWSSSWTNWRVCSGSVGKSYPVSSHRLSEDGIKKAERFGPMVCPASWTGNRKVLYSPCRVQVLLAQKAKGTGLLHHHSLDLLKSPFFPGAPLKAGSILHHLVQRPEQRSRYQVCCRQSLNALSFLLQGRRVGPNKDPPAQCHWSQQIETEFGSEAKETLYFDQRMERSCQAATC